MKVSVLTLLLLLFVVSYDDQITASAKARPETIWLDTDIGTDVDDALALVLLARSSEVNLQLVTTVGAKSPVRALVAKRILESMNMTNVPVIAGLANPLASTRFQQPFPNGIWLGHEGKGVLTEAEINGVSAPENTAPIDQIISALLAAKEKVTVITIGPLTNLAAAVKKEPRIVGRLTRVIVMGGNVLRRPQLDGHQLSPMMEFNLNADREAAAVLFSSGVPIILVPVELTLQSFLTLQDVRDLLAGDQTAHTLGELVEIWTPVFHRIYASFNVPESSYRNIACHLHDVLAVLTAIEPKLIKFREVEITPQEENGIFTTPARTNGKVRVKVAEHMSNDDVRRVLLEQLLRRRA